MSYRNTLVLSAVALASLLASGCASTGARESRDNAGLSPVTDPTLGGGEGVYRFGSKNLDPLLHLDRYPDLRVLLLSDLPDTISEAHIKYIKRWVQDGGVLWVEGRAASSPALEEITPIRRGDFGFKKTATDARGGELVVRDVSPKLVIADHELTDGVQQLYVFPRFKFDGTQNAQPLLQMTGTDGSSGTVIAAVPVGRGYVVLDGTARENRFLFGRIRGFDADHPNAVEQNGGWNSYDWGKLVANADHHATRELAASRGQGESGTGTGRP
jgi:hypothetical protein